MPDEKEISFWGSVWGSGDGSSEAKIFVVIFLVLLSCMPAFVLGQYY